MNEKPALEIERPPLPVWEPHAPQRLTHPVDVAVSVVLEMLGVAAVYPLVLLHQHWRGIVGDVYLGAPAWMITAQIFLLVSAGVTAAFLIRVRKLSFWVPLSAAAIGTIGMSAAIFLIVASLPCPSLC